MKKILILFVLVTTMVLFISSESTYAGDNTKYGFKFSLETISRSGNIEGGSYVYVNPIISINRLLSFNLRVSTNIAPDFATDTIVTLSPQFNFTYEGMDENGSMQHYLAPGVLLNFENGELDKYYGVKYCILSGGRPIKEYPDTSFYTLIDFIPVSYYYNPSTGEELFKIEFMSLGYLF
ncbi:hypothetical protein [Halothermothrix orenii]|uniref:Uncharacterized protein n=1 Tax=Halothermothrix orenii (strain H 168 / OCM 544 / DSM 9562) TaxID=373903 RepID=B8CWC0_HALOH|nr:hypothetical protein [Halothermothrix orenii]ACL69589.1 hypothetical protein Hore_08320 [Halothermothrix orenii H 168]